VDDNRIGYLKSMLSNRGLVILDDNATVQNGSLFEETQLTRLGKVWHRLPPWPDTCHGLDLLNKKYITATLSNTYSSLIHGLVAHGNMPFKHVFSADMFDSYKPDPKVYLGAAEKLGVRPEECALVAAHLGDLKGAKACGFYTIYVERPFEEKNLELRDEQIPDLVVKEDDGGFVALAQRLGIEGAA
jgi:2-haloacid dehalogenase